MLRPFCLGFCMSSFAPRTKGTVIFWDLFLLPNWRSRHPPYHVDTQREVHPLNRKRYAPCTSAFWRAARPQTRARPRQPYLGLVK
eukprot:3458481-Prymnesium_polylepis.1